jgi:hypothetical protein
MKIWEKILWAVGILVLLYCIFNVSRGHAAVHWIDSTSGSDANDGSSLALAWKSAVPYIAHSFTDDDFIYLVGSRKYGACMNDTSFVAPSSGTEGHPITIMSAPGTGIATIDAAAPASIWGTGTGWVHYADSLYYHIIAKDDSCFQVWFRGAESGGRAMTDAALDTDKEFKVSTGAGAELDTLKIYTVDADTSNVTRSKDRTFYSTAKSYLTLKNLKLVHGTGGRNNSTASANVYMLTGRGNEIVECEIDSSNASGISYTTLQMTIAHNLMLNNGSQAGISAGADSAYIYNNTIIGGVRSTSFLTNTNDCIFKNNFCISPVTNFVYVVTDTLNYMDNNFYYGTLANGWRRGAVSCANLATWQANNTGGGGQELNSTASTSSPGTKTATDYRPSAGSALIDAGVDVARVLDFRGYPVPAGSAPDIGAYESNYGSKYIASTGSNDSTGTSADNPWATLEKFSLEDQLGNLNPTDSLYLARSDTLRGQLTLYQSGTSDAHRLISPFGIGDNPVISGSVQPTWVVAGDSIYTADLSAVTLLGDSVLTVYFGGELGTRVMDVGDVDALNEWHYAADTYTLTAYIGANPAVKKCEYVRYTYGITSADVDVHYIDIRSLEAIQQDSFGVFNPEMPVDTWTLSNYVGTYRGLSTPRAFYFADDGNDEAAGTQDAPWQTLSMASNLVCIPGDSLLFKKDDVWTNESAVFELTGTAVNHITISSWGNGTNNPIMYIDDSWTGDTVIGIFNLIDCQYLDIKDIYFKYRADETFTCDILLYVSGGSVLTISTCKFDSLSAGINVEGMYIEGNPDSVFIFNNQFMTGEYGIDEDSGRNIKIYNNLFIDTNDGVMQLESDTAESPVSYEIINNTIFLKNDTLGSFIIGSDASIENSSIIFKNNSIVSRGEYIAHYEAFPIEDTLSVLDIDYNLYWSLNDTVKVQYTDENGNVHTNLSLADWSDSTGFDTHSIFGQYPAFTDTTTYPYDLRPSAGAPGLDQGTAIAWRTVDKDGNPIVGNPDIGAYEGSAAIPTVTTQAASSIEDSTATGNGTITATGGENATSRGFEWDIDSGAPYANSVTVNGDFGAEAFTGSLVTMPTGVTIYARAKATNSAGTGYGEEVNFLLKPGKATNVSATDGSSTAFVRITWTKSTGATDYHVFQDAVDLGATGDVATWNDLTAAAGTINPGTASASDSISSAYVTLSLAGETRSAGATHTYKVVASNATGNSDDSATNTGNRGIGSTLLYQWQRSSGDADADYSNISGAITDPYNDTEGTAGAGYYYKCVLSADGAVDATSTADRGVKAEAAPSATAEWNEILNVISNEITNEITNE